MSVDHLIITEIKDASELYRVKNIYEKRLRVIRQELEEIDTIPRTKMTDEIHDIESDYKREEKYLQNKLDEINHMLHVI
jgi:hypothetical protein